MGTNATEYLTFPMFAISAQIKEGHSIRVAIAGNENSIFRKYPLGAEAETAPPIFTISKGGMKASAIDLPFVTNPTAED